MVALWSRYGGFTVGKDMISSGEGCILIWSRDGVISATKIIITYLRISMDLINLNCAWKCTGQHQYIYI